MIDEPDLQLESLLRRARRGDTEAEGKLLDSYRSYLMLLARVQISCRLEAKANASDIVQETLLHAHRAFGQFMGNTEVELLAWLRKILSSRLVQLLRRYTAQRRDHRLEERLQRELDNSAERLSRGIPANTDTPSRQFARRESTAQLANALEQIPADYREVVILHHLEGCTFDEVAQRMNRTAGAVQKLWIRALVKLRQAMK